MSPRAGGGNSVGNIVAFVVVALLCMIPSAAINAIHQFSHGDALYSYPLALASVLLVALAAACAFVIEGAWKCQRYGLVVLAVAVFCVCTAYNLSSAVGAASTSRSTATGARVADSSRATQIKEQLSEALVSRAKLAKESGDQTPEMIDATIATMQKDDLWMRSKRCIDATLSDSIAFCASYRLKEAARASAVKVGELDPQITSLRAALLASTTTNAVQSADPQVENIAGALSFVGASASPANIGMGLNLWLAVAIEILGALGPVLFCAAMGIRAPTAHLLMRQEVAVKALAPKGGDREPSGASAGQDEQGAQGAHATERAPAQSTPAKPKRVRKKAGAPPAHPIQNEGCAPAQSLKTNDFGGAQPAVLTPKDDLAKKCAEMDAQGMSQVAISKALGVSRRTVQRALEDAKRAASERPSATA